MEKTIEKKSAVADRTTGPILKPLIAFSVPIMLTNILQLLFNAADSIVVGQFGSPNAVGAVGSTIIIINLFINLFTGISAGATVVISNQIGSNSRDVDKTVHTAYAFGILFGIISAVIGFAIAKPFLQLLGTPHEIIDKATLYLRIYFIGQPGFMIYTFARAILISTGETKAPLFYLIISGIINVILNLVLVCWFNLDVAGVAIATIVSQLVSAILTTIKLLKSAGDFHLDFSQIRIHKDKAKAIVRLGLPSGIQSSIFSLAGMTIQGSVNSLGAVVVDGNSAASSLNNFAFQSMAAFAQGAMTFSGQNYGAGKYERLNRVFKSAVICQMVIGVGIAMLVLLAGPNLLRIYLPNSQKAVDAGIVAMQMMMICCFLCGLQDSVSNMLRGMNRSILPMITTIIGNCGLRVMWVFFVFGWAKVRFETLTSFRWLMAAYPITWAFTFFVNLVIYFVVLRKLKRRKAV